MKKRIVDEHTIEQSVTKSVLWASEFSKRLTVIILLIYCVNFILGWVYQFMYHDGYAPMVEVCSDLMKVVAECYLVKSGIENVSKGVCSILYKKWGLLVYDEQLEEDSEE